MPFDAPEQRVPSHDVLLQSQCGFRVLSELGSQQKTKKTAKHILKSKIKKTKGEKNWQKINEKKPKHTYLKLEYDKTCWQQS